MVVDTVVVGDPVQTILELTLQFLCTSHVQAVLENKTACHAQLCAFADLYAWASGVVIVIYRPSLFPFHKCPLSLPLLESGVQGPP